MNRIQLFAFADEACPNMVGQIAAMKRNGLNGLEIRGVDGENVSKISLAKAAQVRTMLEDNGLRTWSVGSPIGKIKMTDDFDAHLDVFRHTLDVARELGAENLRLFSFFIPKGEDPAPYADDVMYRLSRFIEVADGSGIVLCHENEKGIYGDVADRCLQIHKAFPQLKAIFDPANFVQSGDDTLRGWEMLKDYVRYLHIKDALDDGSVVPSGKGSGNVPFIVKDYVARGGCSMTLEPHLKVFEGLKDLEEDGNTSVVGKFAYPSANAAFDAACNALKEILAEV